MTFNFWDLEHKLKLSNKGNKDKRNFEENAFIYLRILGVVVVGIRRSIFEKSIFGIKMFKIRCRFSSVVKIEKKIKIGYNIRKLILIEITIQKINKT